VKAYTIKPLGEWGGFVEREFDLGQDFLTVSTFFGGYNIVVPDPKRLKEGDHHYYCVLRFSMGWSNRVEGSFEKSYANINEAKAAAEAHYIKQLEGALEEI